MELWWVWMLVGGAVTISLLFLAAGVSVGRDIKRWRKEADEKRKRRLIVDGIFEPLAKEKHAKAMEEWVKL